MKRVTAILVAALLAAAIIGGTAGSAAAGCSTVGCFNQKITKLTRKVNNLARHVRQAEKQATASTAFQSCLRRTAVTQYFGYEFGGSFYTTALDFTEPGDPVVSAYFLRDTCATIPVGRVTTAPLSK